VPTNSQLLCKSSEAEFEHILDNESLLHAEVTLCGERMRLSYKGELLSSSCMRLQ